MRSLLFVVVAGLVVAFATGCKRKREINGFGPYQFGKTMFGDVQGDCKPQAGVVWCPAHPLDKHRHVQLGGQNAVVGLYFAHKEPASPLIEIALRVRGCQADRLRAWISDNFGDPSKESGKRVFWSGKYTFVSATLPAPDCSCVISMVSAKDEKRIAELQANK